LRSPGIRLSRKIHHEHLFFWKRKIHQRSGNHPCAGARPFKALHTSTCWPYHARHSSVTCSSCSGKIYCGSPKQHGHSVEVMLRMYPHGSTAQRSDIQAIQQAMEKDRCGRCNSQFSCCNFSVNQREIARDCRDPPRSLNSSRLSRNRPSDSGLRNALKIKWGRVDCRDREAAVLRFAPDRRVRVVLIAPRISRTGFVHTPRTAK